MKPAFLEGMIMDASNIGELWKSADNILLDDACLGGTRTGDREDDDHIVWHHLSNISSQRPMGQKLITFN